MSDFLNPVLEKEMFLEWTEGMVDMGYITRSEYRAKNRHPSASRLAGDLFYNVFIIHIYTYS